MSKPTASPWQTDDELPPQKMIKTMQAYQFSGVTEAEILAAFGASNFGDRSTPPAILAHGILQISAGFRTGGTLMAIMVHLGLVTRTYRTTKRGRLYAFDFYDDTRKPKP